MMKLCVIVGIGTIFLMTVFVGYRSCFHHQREPVEAQHEAISSAEWTPPEINLMNGNQGVGWVFGRMIGVSGAPGSPNHSPFGHATPRPMVNGFTPITHE